MKRVAGDGICSRYVVYRDILFFYTFLFITSIEVCVHICQLLLCVKNRIAHAIRLLRSAQCNY
jgi:hypothetical protein